MLEIERKFLIYEIPDLAHYPFDEIEQGYISFEPEIRIRKKGSKCYLTEKGEGTKIRPEVNLEISQEIYEVLSHLVQGRMIQKTRYKIPIQDHLIAEFDLYHDELEGLMVVETEFSSEEQSQNFIPPVWFGEDITEDKRYKNKNLAKVDAIDFLKHKKQNVYFKKRDSKSI